MGRSMKKYLPYIFGGLGLLLLVSAMILRGGSADVHAVVTNLASTFMLVGGGICILIGLVTFFLRDDEVW